MIRPFGQHGFEAQTGQGCGQVVIVDAFRMLEAHGFGAEQLLQARGLGPDLMLKFLARIEEGQGMGAGFTQKFHAARGGQGLEAVQHFGRVLLKKVQGRAGNGKGQTEGALVAADEPEHKLVGGQIAEARCPQQGFAVAVVVFVQRVLPHVEHGVAAQLIRLVNLKTQAESWHQ